MEINVLPGVQAPSFGGVAWCNGWSDISLSDNIAKKNWTILFFYPLDFGYIAPSELMELENCRTELEGLKCNIVALSTDSAVTHEKFCSIQPRYGGVQGIEWFLRFASLTGAMDGSSVITRLACFSVEIRW